MAEKSCVFALYRNGEFQGFRQDTFGTIGKDWGKIYGYSKEQVEIVIQGTEYNLKGNTGLGKVLKKLGADPDLMDEISKKEEETFEKNYKDASFELRVLEGPTPEYEKEFNIEKAKYVTSSFPSYDGEKLRELYSNPDSAEILEVHKFSLFGQLNVQ